LSQSTRLTDRQTDGHADGPTDRILIARPRLHSMQRGKNYRFFSLHLFSGTKNVGVSSTTFT